MHIAKAKLGQPDTGDNEAKLMTKLAPEWVRTSDPVIRNPARYRWTTAPASRILVNSSLELLIFITHKNNWLTMQTVLFCLFVCWSLTSLCHSNGHIETMPAREINPFTALTRIRS